MAADQLRADLVVQEMHEGSIFARAAGGVLAFAPADQPVVSLDAQDGGIECGQAAEIASVLFRRFDGYPHPPCLDVFDAHLGKPLRHRPQRAARDLAGNGYFISGSSVSAVMRI